MDGHVIFPPVLDTDGQPGTGLGFARGAKGQDACRRRRGAVGQRVLGGEAHGHAGTGVYRIQGPSLRLRPVAPRWMTCRACVSLPPRQAAPAHLVCTVRRALQYPIFTAGVSVRVLKPLASLLQAGASVSTRVIAWYAHALPRLVGASRTCTVVPLLVLFAGSWPLLSACVANGVMCYGCAPQGAVHGACLASCGAVLVLCHGHV